MMHLTGAGSNVHVGKTMAGLDRAKKQNTDSKALQFNKKQGVDEEEDNAVKKLQSQINTLRDKIQELSENETMDAKTKAELIQSTKEQMSELSQQLKQRQFDLQQEKLEKEEEAQKESKMQSSNKDVSKNTGRSKYDSYTKDDEVTQINAAVISASNQMDIAKKQKYFSTYKGNQIKILERDIERDTKLVERKEVSGHDKKTIGKVLEYNSYATSGEASERISNTLRKAQEENSPALNKEIESVYIADIWELKRGFAIEQKDESIAKLKSEISGLRKIQAQSLGDANRIINGSDNESE
ncbi:MAG: hypothetical protein K2J79_09575, partial [Ruminiclostridium sp.]|nr:hypothetical protein [Ruminiclostridium sp.]